MVDMAASTPSSERLGASRDGPGSGDGNEGHTLSVGL